MSHGPIGWAPILLPYPFLTTVTIHFFPTQKHITSLSLSFKTPHVLNLSSWDGFIISFLISPYPRYSMFSAPTSQWSFCCSFPFTRKVVFCYLSLWKLWRFFKDLYKCNLFIALFVITKFHVIFLLWLSKGACIFLLALSLFYVLRFFMFCFFFKIPFLVSSPHTHTPTHYFYNLLMKLMIHYLPICLFVCTSSVNIYWVKFTWQLAPWKWWTVKVWEILYRR